MHSPLEAPYNVMGKDSISSAHRNVLRAGCSKDSEARRANCKDESGNLKAEVSFQLSYFMFHLSKDYEPFQQPASLESQYSAS
jgi:hypothetical protein